jgi:hypothetical protein
MPVVVTCPACTRKLQVPEEFFGKNVQCPECKQAFLAEPVEAPVGATSAPKPASSSVPMWEQSPAVAPREAVSDRSRQRPPWDEDDRATDDHRRRRDVQPHRAGMILAFGILAVLPGGLGLVFGPMAWIMGNADLRLMRAGQMDPSGESQTNTGRILGMVGTLLHLCGFLLVCAGFGMMILAGLASHHAHRH